MEVSNELEMKLEKLKYILKGYGKLAIAFSGGVDSTFLLKVATEVLHENVMAIYIDSPLQPDREKKEVHQLVRRLGAELHILSVDELEHSAFQNNPPDRCYYCKGLIFDSVLEVAHLKGIFIVADGSNLDDTKDYRPGVKALRERGIKSPLQEVDLTKEEIRTLSKAYNLPTWDKDALACLATRIPFGTAITRDKLLQVDKAEEFLLCKGFRNVRARYFGDTVRIEVRKDQVKLFENQLLKNEIAEQMQKIGFYRMEIAEEGYQRGPMNQK
jgi:uncharacterized protein